MEWLIIKLQQITRPRFIIWKSGIIRGRILGRIRGDNSTWVLFESLRKKLAFTILASSLADLLMHARICVLTLEFDHFWTGLVFILRVNTIVGFQNWASTWLRAQTFDIHLDGECRIGTPICRYLLIIYLALFWFVIVSIFLGLCFQSAIVVYMCFIFYSMQQIFAFPGWRHACILKK